MTAQLRASQEGLSSIHKQVSKVQIIDECITDVRFGSKINFILVKLQVNNYQINILSLHGQVVTYTVNVFSDA
jgi:hypothetical protein